MTTPLVDALAEVIGTTMVLRTSPTEIAQAVLDHLAADPELRRRMAEAMAEQAGSRAFKNPTRAWDDFRAMWLEHADAAQSALTDEVTP